MELGEIIKLITDNGIGLVSSRVMTCAGHEAHMIIRLLIGEKNP